MLREPLGGLGRAKSVKIAEIRNFWGLWFHDGTADWRGQKGVGGGIKCLGCCRHRMRTL